MGFYVSRQRDAKDNNLYVECAIGSKNTGPDILPCKYKASGENKLLVSPIDAISIAERIYKKWNNDYADETKKLRIVDGGTKPLVFDFSPKDLKKAKDWAEKEYSNMEKCGSCKKPMGSRDFCEHEDLSNMVFCDERCLSVKYKDMFGVEAPAVMSNKTKKAIKRKP